jgi:hypothetical protein
MGKPGKFMLSSQSSECILRTAPFEPFGRFPKWIPSGDWAEKSGWSPARRNCGYGQKLLFFHIVRTLPLSKSLSNPCLLEAVKAKKALDGKERFYHSPHRFSRKKVNIKEQTDDR